MKVSQTNGFLKQRRVYMFALCVRMLLRFCSIYFKTPLTVLERIRCLVGGSVYLTSSSNSWTKWNKLLSNSDSSTFINYQGVHSIVTNLNNLIYIYIYLKDRRPWKPCFWAHDSFQKNQSTNHRFFYCSTPKGNKHKSLRLFDWVPWLYVKKSKT